MHFLVNLIVVKKSQEPRAAWFLNRNATPIGNFVWLFVGDTGYLDDEGVKYNLVTGKEKGIACHGSMTAAEKRDMIFDYYGVNVDELKYEEEAP